MMEVIAPRQPGNPAWRKGGPSPNPAGRPRVIAELRDLAREHTVEALETLVEIMGDKEAPPAARVTAARELLDRGYGRPVQEHLVAAEIEAKIEADAPRALTQLEQARQVAFALALVEANGAKV